MAVPVTMQADDEFLSRLEDASQGLVEQLQNDNLHDASKIIYQLTEQRDEQLFNSIGKLTRALHTAITNFNVDANLSSESSKGASSEISDASDRLHYVLDLTNAAAEATMDKVESCVPIATDLGEEASTLKQDWLKLRRREISKEEFKVLFERIDGFLDKMDSGTSSLRTNLQDIVLEQGFQDLTGQALKKVITLVTDVEKQLVDLVKIAGDVENVTGVKAPDIDKQDSKHNANGIGPVVCKDVSDEVVTSQDDVDDLLSSLGF